MSKLKSYEIDNPAEILKLRVQDASSFFNATNTLELKDEYRRLCSKWHPDKNLGDKDTSAVFAHLKSLYEYFSKSLDSEFIVFSDKVILNTKDNAMEVAFRRKHECDFGEVFVGNSIISYTVLSEYVDLEENAIRNLAKLKFADKKMQDEISKYLPVLRNRVVKPTDKLNFLVFNKAKNTVLLTDLLKHCGGAIDPKHVAWILSSMYNMACFFQYNKLFYGGFTIEDYLVNPEKHLGVTSSFWYSKELGSKLSALSAKALSVAPVSVLNTKRADVSLDLEMIRLVGRELLGDAGGIKLAKNPAIPSAMLNWLRGASTGDAFKDYKIWHEDVLRGSFGVRRFTEMGIKFNDIYY